MNNLTILFIFFACFIMNAQEMNIPHDVKASEKYIYCYSADSEVKWVKILNSPPKKLIEKIQRQLNLLNYKVVETGIVDFQTKRQLKQFNEDQGIGSYEMILYDTQKLLKELCKKKKKTNRKNT